MSFYVTLPSNSSMDIYPQNTMTEFSVQLKDPITFDIQYEVALVELTYKHSWSLEVGKIIIRLPDTIENESLKLIFHDGESIVSFTNRLNAEVLEYFVKKEYDRRYKLSVSANEEHPNELMTPSDPYESLNRDQSLIIQITQEILMLVPQFRSERFRFYMKIPENSQIRFEGDILRILNLQNSWYKPSKGIVYNISGLIDESNPTFIQSLFVYCDIIDYQYVGDAFVPLLRNVVVDNSYLKTAWVHYDNPHYLCVNKSQISTIRVEIKDDAGERVHFEKGKVLLKLHFRPKRV